MMKTNSQKRILPLALSGGILICLICIYSGRSVLLRSIVNRHTSRIEQTHGLCIHYDKLEMNGLNEIYLQCRVSVSSCISMVDRNLFSLMIKEGNTIETKLLSFRSVI